MKVGMWITVRTELFQSGPFGYWLLGEQVKRGQKNFSLYLAVFGFLTMQLHYPFEVF
jgi:hypothetical protein